MPHAIGSHIPEIGGLTFIQVYYLYLFANCAHRFYNAATPTLYELCTKGLAQATLLFRSGEQGTKHFYKHCHHQNHWPTAGQR